MMALTELLQRANRGDQAALAQLLQAALPPAIQVETRLKQQSLQILLTGPQAKQPDRAGLLRALGQALQRVTLPIGQVYIYYSVARSASPLWTESRSWAQMQSQPPRARGAAQSRSTMPRWLAEKPDFPALWAAAQAHFSLGKLFGVLLIALYGLFFARHYNISDWLEGNHTGPINFIHGANLIFHEAGHMIFRILGEFMAILGGSLNQILIPTGISGYFFWKGQRYSGAVTLAWMGENFWDVSIYASDASTTLLPLLGGDGTIHDWNWLLETLGWLRYTTVIANLLYGIGVLIYLTAIGLGIYYSRHRSAFTDSSRV
jgi:hypothetical protein